MDKERDAGAWLMEKKQLEESIWRWCLCKSAHADLPHNWLGQRLARIESSEEETKALHS